MLAAQRFVFQDDFALPQRARLVVDHARAVLARRVKQERVQALAVEPAFPGEAKRALPDVVDIEPWKSPPHLGSGKQYDIGAIRLLHRVRAIEALAEVQVAGLVEG